MASGAVAAAGGAMLAAVEEDLEVQVVAGFAGEEALEVALGLEHGLPSSKLPTTLEGGWKEGLAAGDLDGLVIDEKRKPVDVRQLVLSLDVFSTVSGRNGDPYGTRTRVASVKGMCPNR